MTTIFHITHWKAGSQWIRGILETLVPERIVEPRVGEGQVLVDPIRPGGVYPTVYLTREQFLTANLPADSRCFVVIRDLRDTLVSSYFSFRHSHAMMTGLSAEMRQRLVELPFDEGMKYLLENWLQNCASITASWLGAEAPVLKYEDLLQHDIDLLEELLIDKCGLDVDRDAFREVVIANRFEAKAQGRDRGAEDVSAHLRKGVSGDWREKLSPLVLTRFDELFGMLNEAAGFEPSFAASSKTMSAPVAYTAEPDAVIEGFRAASAMYPNVLPLNYWLGFEFAALRKFQPSGRVLDVNCRDGRFFNTVFPELKDAEGVETDKLTAELAAANRIYSNVHVFPSYADMTFDGEFDTVIANGVIGAGGAFRPTLNALKRAMKPGGRLICSVRTNYFSEWLMLPSLMEAGGCKACARELLKDYLKYHHFNELPSETRWIEMFEEEGLTVSARAPLAPEFSAKLCLFIDMLWHLTPSGEGGELGGQIASRLSAVPGFSDAFAGIVRSLLSVEGRPSEGAGVIFELTK